MSDQKAKKNPQPHNKTHPKLSDRELDILYRSLSCLKGVSTKGEPVVSNILIFFSLSITALHDSPGHCFLLPWHAWRTHFPFPKFVEVLSPRIIFTWRCNYFCRPLVQPYEYRCIYRSITWATLLLSYLALISETCHSSTTQNITYLPTSSSSSPQFPYFVSFQLSSWVSTPISHLIPTFLHPSLTSYLLLIPASSLDLVINLRPSLPTID